MAGRHFPKELRDRYELHEWKHACAILKHDFREEWRDLIDMLSTFRLKKSWIVKGGGSKSDLPTVPVEQGNVSQRTLCRETADGQTATGVRVP